MFKIGAMSFPRQRWIDRVRDRFLGGALGEYAKLAYARRLNFKDCWSKEVVSILSQIAIYMDKKNIQTSGWSRIKALKEAIREASSFQDQVLDAKNTMLSYEHLTREQEAKLFKITLLSKDLMPQMLEEFGEQAGIDGYLGEIEKLK